MSYYTISNEEFEEITEGDDYEAVTKEQLVDESRWSISYCQVFQHKQDGTYWEISWDRPATEYQECEPSAIKAKVKPVEVKAIKYVLDE